MKIPYFRNRMAAELGNRNGLTEVRNGGAPFFWNGSPVQFEIGFVNKGGVIVNDLTDIDQVQLELKRGDARTGVAVMSKTLASGSLNGSLTQTAWDGGADTDCHALIKFGGSEADIDLEGELTGDFWLVISVIKTVGAGGDTITAGCCQLSIEEDGRGTATPAGVIPPTYWTAAQSDARYVMAVDLTTINNNITTLQGQMTTANANITAVTTTANNALPKAGGTMTGHIVLYTGTNPTGAQAISAGRADALYVPLIGGTMTGHLTLYTGTNPTGAQAISAARADAVYLALAGGTVTGGVTFNAIPSCTVAPTSGNHLTNKTYVDGQISGLVNAAPGALDTLKELADALGDDPNYATTVTNALAGKLALAGGTMTGHLTLYTGTNPTGAQAISAGRADAVYLALAGGTMTGAISCATAPTIGNHLTNKTYVDGAVATAVPLAGGTMTGLLSWNTTVNAGLKLNNLTDAQRVALSSPAAGMIIFNTTTSTPMFYSGTAWVSLNSGSPGTTWLTGSGAPGAGTGADGNYYIDSATLDIYKKATGAWSLAGPQKLSLGGGTLTGTLTMASAIHIYFDGGANPSYELYNSSSKLYVVGGGQTIGQWDSSDVSLNLADPNGILKVNGTRVVKARQAAVTSPSADVNSLKTAVDAIISRLQTHGLIS